MLPCKHTTPVPTCRICWLAENDERYKNLFANERPVAHAKPSKTIEIRKSCCGKTPRIGTTLNMGAGGLGDGLQGLLAVSALRRLKPDGHITYRVGPKAFPFVQLFEGYDELRLHQWDNGGSVHLHGPDLQLNNDYYAEITGQTKETRVQRYCRNAGVTEPHVPSLRFPHTNKNRARDYAGCIALCPFSDGSDREYSLQAWITLEDVLAKAGYRTVLLGSDPHRAKPHQGEKVTNAEPDLLAAILQNAACVIGIDSGLTHLGAILGTPTLALMGQTKDVFTAYPHAKELFGPLSCVGCYWRAPTWTSTCRPLCPAIQAITPERILHEVDDVVLPVLANRSLLTVDRLRSIRTAVLATHDLSGDLAEFGVYRGGTAALIKHYAKGGTLHLFDTFAGIPENDVEGGHHKQGDFKADLAEVRALVGAAEYHVGVFPGTAPLEARYRMVHVDCDTYQSCLCALDYFGPRMVSGGTMLFDDFGSPACPGIAKALHERGWSVEHSARMQGRVKFK